MIIRRTLIAALTLAALVAPIAGVQAQSQLDKTGSGGATAGQEGELFTTPVIIGAAAVAVAVGVIVATTSGGDSQSSNPVSTRTSTSTTTTR